MTTKTFYAPNEVGAFFEAENNSTVPQILQTVIASSSAVTGHIVPAATTVWNLYPSYGTGTAPSNGGATAGTQLTYVP